jgi:predicted phage terminase large subunit-like protein
VETLGEVQRELARRSLLRFILYTLPTYEAGWFHEHVCDELDRFLADVHDGTCPRLILCAPPRHGKSEIVSRRFPAYALGRDPDLTIIATSYGADLASAMNRDVQRIIDSDEYASLFPATRLFSANVRTTAQGTWLRNSDVFEVVNHQGVYKSAGVGGGITGRGGHILLVDDPIKDAEQADSSVYRQRVWDWFTSTLYTRQAPGAGILIILTRWHEDDLVGRLLDAAKKGEGEQYRVVSFPAVAETDEPCRKEGEPLHAARYPLSALTGPDGKGGIRLAVGSRVWASLYQQRPAAAEGALFKRANWRYFKPHTDDIPTLVRDLGITRIVQSWDTAAKKGQENDYSACTTIGVAPSRYYILDLWKHKVEYPELKRAATAQHAKWNPHVVVVEDTSAGVAALQELKRDTRIPLAGVTPKGDKVARANAVTPIHEAGLCYLPEGAPWVADFLDSISAFPNAMHDDDVDSFTQGLGYITRGGGGMGLWEFMKAEAERAKMARAGTAQGVA